ncbi:MAG: hypothetical protein K2O29_02970 [Ruminococcus sp.]|nr:hypothetical protein [Ruminococcus sp.]
MGIVFYLILVVSVLVFCIRKSFDNTVNQLLKPELSEEEQIKDKNKGWIMICMNFFLTFIICGVFTDDIVDGIVSFFFIGIPFIWLPLMLTCFNIINLIKNRHTAISTDMTTIFVGGVHYIFLMDLIGSAIHGGITNRPHIRKPYIPTSTMK